MERVMTVEEKIRRAEEIYEKRKQGEIRPVAKVTVNDKKDIKLLKKMVIQILICMTIYLIFYIVQKNQYVFSEDFINKANEILSYDTNFVGLYEMIKEQIASFGTQKQEKEQEPESVPEQEQQPKQEGASDLEGQQNEEAIGGAEETKEEPNTENVSQEQMDIENIKNTTSFIKPVEGMVSGFIALYSITEYIKSSFSFIKPVEGMVSSPYGNRDNATGSVPKNHTGTDIAANLGTKIIAATDGEVVLSSEEGDYRKTFKNSNRGS